MSKFKIITFSLLILLISCKNDSEEKTVSKPETEESAEDKNEEINFSTIENQTLENWKKYYQTMDSAFNLAEFEFVSTSDLESMKGSVHAKYEEEFDTIYNNFLIYSPSKEKYLDIDSYYWQIKEEEGKDEILYAADQEINVIDLKDSTIHRIAFRGPSFTVEDAYWKDENQVVLLEGTYESSPNINVIDLEKEKIYSYSYPDTLNKRSLYTDKRIKEKIE